MALQHTYPKLHNAMWPGLVGKGSPGAEPAIDLDTMLDLTAKASVDGAGFDGVDLFLFDPHLSIDATGADLKRLADNIASRGFVVGSLVAPVWPPTGGGSAMGSDEDRRNFLTQVRKACAIGKELRNLGIRPYGVVRIDSSAGPGEWANDPDANTKRIVNTFREACDIAESYGERLAAEGEICWGGMHSWKRMVQLLEMVNRPKTLGFQADMAHTLLFTMGYNAPEDRILPDSYDWKDRHQLDEALRTLTNALRPWTIDFHVAQNDATVFGSGTHDKTGRHCLPTDPNGKLDVVRHAGLWMRDDGGQPTKAFEHICWDGCMFPNATMMQQNTWNDILRLMLDVRSAHGWDAPVAATAQAAGASTQRG
jgi:sugar phosphate isomerase/epimerase